MNDLSSYLKKLEKRRGNKPKAGKRKEKKRQKIESKKIEKINKRAGS